MARGEAERDPGPGDADGPAADDRDAARRRLIEVAYSPDATPAESATAARALRDLDSMPAAAPDTVPAHAHAHAPAPDSVPAPATAPNSVPAPATAPNSVPAPATAPAALRRPSARRTGALLAGVAVAAFGLGIAATTAGATLRPGTAAPTPSPTITADAPLTVSVITRALGRVQVQTDALPTALRGDVDARSSRLLYDDDPRASATRERWRLWLGTGENPQQLCFVGTFDNVTDQVTCVPADRAMVDRYVFTQTTRAGTFEVLVNGGAVAVAIE
ncbi:hypothetical protein [Frondihabitans sp. PhB188]|uniref:hypothetical protein n=1 Tax=Frondihabitans sp. PhB188 TaxID=2485200 RepID=UPI000F4985A6|nr:hypothetical protein [Frondihabitans sp. PhB188]